MAPAQERPFDDVPGDLPAETHPMALLPVHLETRFVANAGSAELLVRVYPDDLHTDTHEPELTSEEDRWGRHFWQQTWRAGAGPGEAAVQRRARAWAQLAERFGATRAAWVARVLAPDNPGDRPDEPVDEAEPLPSKPTFAAHGTRAAAWTRAPQARLLPDRWIVVGYRDGERVLLDWSAPISAEVATGPQPDSPPPEAASDDELVVDPGMRWIVDFAEAERVGMALRILLEPVDAERGFDTLAVFGVRASIPATASADELAALLDAHHYTDGLAIVPPGTPTNNTSEHPAGYRSQNTDHDLSFSTERGGPGFRPGDGTDGDLAAKALGVPARTFTHVAGSDGMADADARHMHTALWPATWGYFLDHIIGLLGDDDAAHARRHFIDHVRGGGPLATLRVGSQPYGLVPATPLDHWAPRDGHDRDRGLVELLRAVRRRWRQAIAHVPHVAGGLRTQGELLHVLGMEAVSSSYAARPIFDREHVSHLVADGDPRAIADKIAHGLRVAPEVLATLGIEREPRLAALALARHAFPLDAPLTPPAADVGDVITWLRDADYGDLFDETGPGPGTSLLYLLLRHAMMVGHANAAWRILRSEGLADDGPEPALVDATTNAPSGGTATLGRFLDEHIPDLGDGPISQHLGPEGAATDRPEAAQLGELRTSLTHLATRAPAALGRTLSETLDACSHRYDAWATSLATKRLSQVREQHPDGVHVGAYGWVENLRPAPEPSRIDPPPGEGDSPLAVSEANAGYVHAPSVDHAATAAILRSGHLSHPGGSDNDAAAPFAVDLSSKRVRLARSLLDGVRGGQPLAVLLGYRFERRLHERGLDEFVEPFRRLAPLGELYQALGNMNLLQGFVGSLEDLAEGHEEELEEAKIRRDEARERLRELPTKKELRDRAAAKEREADRIEAEELPHARDGLRMAHAVLQNAKRKNADPDLIKVLEGDLARAEDRVEELELAEKVLRTTAGQLREDAEDLPEKKAEAQRLLADANEDVNEAREDLADGQQQLWEMRGKLREAEDEFERLEQERRDRFLYPPTTGIEAMASIAARGVADGLRLLRLHQDNTIPWGFTLEGHIDLPNRDDDRAAAVIAELDLLAAAVDAVTDASVAEGIYQAVRGNPERAAAALDTVTRGETAPAEIDVTRTPRSGVGVTHRVVTLLGGDVAGRNPWPDDAGSPRARAAPRLNAWAGRLLGDPARVRCTVEYREAEGSEPLATTDVRLVDLQLSPLDVVHAAQTQGSASAELEQRLYYHAARVRPDRVTETADVHLRFSRRDVWSREDLSFAEILEVAHAAAKVIGGARHADARDLSIPEDAAPSGIDVNELAERADRAVGGLRLRLAEIDRLVDSGDATADAMRAGLLALAAFGVPGVIPRSATGDTTGALDTLREQCRAAADAARRRLDTAKGASDGLDADETDVGILVTRHAERLNAVFGREFRVLPRFAAANGAELAQTFSDRDTLDGDPLAAVGWFQRAARVREGVARLSRLLLYTESLGTAPLDLHVGQLPHVPGERWVGLAPPDGESIPGGRLSLVAQAVDSPPFNDPQTGLVSLAGLVIDEWNEVVPNARETTAVTFNFDEPGARAPQAVLLAVPPNERPQWDLETLEATVLDTLELSKLRAVDPDALGEVDDVAVFLPAAHIALNLAGDTVSTDLARAATGR